MYVGLCSWKLDRISTPENFCSIKDNFHCNTGHSKISDDKLQYVDFLKYSDCKLMWAIQKLLEVRCFDRTSVQTLTLNESSIDNNILGFPKCSGIFYAAVVEKANCKELVTDVSTYCLFNHISIIGSHRIFNQSNCYTMRTTACTVYVRALITLADNHACSYVAISI